MAHLNDIEKRGMIIGEARKLFLRFGFSKTSMEDIAHQCSIAKPTLYYYYANKEAIFDAIVSEEAENFLKKLDQKLSEDLPADQKVLLFLNIVYDHLNLYAKELANIIGVSDDTVINWEKDRNKPQGENMEKVEKFLMD